MKNKKKIIMIGVIVVVLIVAIIVAVLLLTNKDKEENKGYTNKRKEETVEPTVQVVDLESTSRPYAVMINNLGVARPYHSGLQDAYLVYEIIVEGGITRYMALFKDKTPEIVGSVRSARHYYLDYALENDAYYVHWGWSPQAQSDISKFGVNNINGLTYSTPYFFRKNYGNVSSEHTGYVNLNEISKLVEKIGYRTENNKDLLLNYSATNINPEVESTEALKIDLKYSGSFITNYEYDEASNTYKQFVNSKEHVDYQTKEQYTVKNIITYQVKNSSIDSYGRQTLDNIGKGEGYFITGGKSYEITWEKKDRSSQTVYKYKETGEEITVNDGNTWIHIVPTSGSISIS